MTHQFKPQMPADINHKVSEELETARFYLRKLHPEKDFAGFCDLMGDANSVRFLGGKTLTPPEVWRLVAMYLGHWEIRGYGFFSVLDKKTHDWVGRIGPWFPHGWPAPEIGWAVHPKFSRLGIATEVGAACIRYAKSGLGWRKVVHVIHPKNIGSIKTAQKLGAHLVGHVNGVPAVTNEVCNVYGYE